METAAVLVERQADGPQVADGGLLDDLLGGGAFQPLHRLLHCLL